MNKKLNINENKQNNTQLCRKDFARILYKIFTTFSSQIII